METIIQRTDVRMLCLPAEDIAAWRVDERIESAYRAAHASDPLTETRLGNWRILRKGSPGE